MADRTVDPSPAELAVLARNSSPEVAARAAVGAVWEPHKDVDGFTGPAALAAVDTEVAAWTETLARFLETVRHLDDAEVVGVAHTSGPMKGRVDGDNPVAAVESPGSPRGLRLATHRPCRGR
jgi:hypothetical protein